MKKTLSLAAIAVFALSFAACKKCSTCTVTDSYGETIYTAPESCGKKKKVIDDYQAGVKAEWEGHNSDWTVTCTDPE